MNEDEGFEGLTTALARLADSPLETPNWLAGTITETVVQRAYRMTSARRVRQTVSSPKVLGGGALVAAGLTGVLLFNRRRNRRRPTARARLRSALA